MGSALSFAEGSFVAKKAACKVQEVPERHNKGGKFVYSYKGFAPKKDADPAADKKAEEKKAADAKDKWNAIAKEERERQVTAAWTTYWAKPAAVQPEGLPFFSQWSFDGEDTHYDNTVTKFKTALSQMEAQYRVGNDVDVHTYPGFFL